jgi:antitoxin YefM
MKTITYTTARAQLAKTMQKVCEDHAPMIITRASAEPVVMISLSDFEAMNETNYLMSSPANAARLVDAMEEIERMIGKEKKK